VLSRGHFSGVAPAHLLARQASRTCTPSHLRAALAIFFDATRPICDNDTTPPLPPNRRTYAIMEEPKYTAGLLRMWRVWRTAKEMMNERVRCACAGDANER
jgi:hypothetical protein